jgi:hypothetical protein
MKSLRGQGFAAMISGAGPSVLVLGRQSDLAVLQDQHVPGFSVRISGIGTGASIIEPSFAEGAADQNEANLAGGLSSRMESSDAGASLRGPTWSGQLR